MPFDPSTAHLYQPTRSVFDPSTARPIGEPRNTEPPADQPDLVSQYNQARDARTGANLGGGENVSDAITAYLQSKREPGWQPGVAERTAGAIAHVAGQFNPETPADLAGTIFQTPVTGAYHQVHETYNMLRDWIGGKSMSEAAIKNFPEHATLAEADKTPAFSQERFNAAGDVLSQFAMAAGITHGMQGRLFPTAEPKPPLDARIGVGQTPAEINKQFTLGPVTQDIPQRPNFVLQAPRPPAEEAPNIELNTIAAELRRRMNERGVVEPPQPYTNGQARVNPETGQVISAPRTPANAGIYRNPEIGQQPEPVPADVADQLHNNWYENEAAINKEKARANPDQSKIESLENSQISDYIKEQEIRWRQNQRSSLTQPTPGEPITPGPPTRPNSPTSTLPPTSEPARPAGPSSTESGTRNLPPEPGAAPLPPAPSPSPQPSRQGAWDKIIAGNPILKQPGFKSGVKRWNELYQMADEAGLSPGDKTAFIKHGMEGVTFQPAQRAAKFDDATFYEQSDGSWTDTKDGKSADMSFGSEAELRQAMASGGFNQSEIEKQIGGLKRPQPYRQGQGSTPPTENATTGQPGASTGQPAGTSNRIFTEAHGVAEVPSGHGADTGAMLDDARAAIQSGRVDPYEILSRTRGHGIATPEEYAALAAEHERLVNDAVARQRAGDPGAADAQKYANDFANAIQPHKTAASDLMRLFQGDLNYDMGTTFGIDQYMKAELGRNMTAAEQPKFQKKADAIRNGETEVVKSIGEADKQVQRRYAKVADIPIEEAAARVRQMLGDCMV